VRGPHPPTSPALSSARPRTQIPRKTPETAGRCTELNYDYDYDYEHEFNSNLNTPPTSFVPISGQERSTPALHALPFAASRLRVRPTRPPSPVQRSPGNPHAEDRSRAGKPELRRLPPAIPPTRARARARTPNTEYRIPNTDHSPCAFPFAASRET